MPCATAPTTLRTPTDAQPQRGGSSGRAARDRTVSPDESFASILTTIGRVVRSEVQGDSMAQRRTGPERLSAFSDAVFAVIITVLVLELKPPSADTFSALLPLWPIGLSYAVSYLFIAIVWVNHHHLLNYADEATPRLVWSNFAHLFSVSLIPFTTQWIAESRLAAA